MLFENAGAAAGVAAVGGMVAAAGAAMGWLAAPVALAVLVGGVVLGALLLAFGRRARRARAAEADAAERVWRRADGPWPAYDRRRNAPGEPIAPEPLRDRQTAE